MKNLSLNELFKLRDALGIVLEIYPLGSDVTIASMMLDVKAEIKRRAEELNGIGGL